MRKSIDLVGKRFEKLKVVRRAEDYISPSGGKFRRWECECECGGSRIVLETSLINNRIKMCCLNCINRKPEKVTINGTVFYRHGMSGTPLHRKWCGMKARCYHKNTNGYENYGGRGIKICDEWLGSYGFQNFYKWSIENGYRDGMTIDRKDTNGNYEPSNCRWVTQEEQDNNKRTNHFLEYNGKTQTIAKWSRETGIDKNTLISRVDRYGWNVEEALTTPPNGRIKIKKEKPKKERKKINRNSVSNRKCFYCENYDRRKGYCELHKQDKKNWNMCKSFNWKDGV